jgi:hypothetical protein
VGRDYSRKKQFLPSIRCQTSFGFTRAVRPTKSTGPSVGGAPGERRASWAVVAGGGDSVKPSPDRFDLLAVAHSRSRSR